MHSEWKSKSTGTNLISEIIYTKIVKVLLNFNKMIGIQSSYMYCWKNHYHILSNEKLNCLYQRVVSKSKRRFKGVRTYEKIFDIIYRAHKALGRAKYRRKTKNKIQILW